MVARATSSGGSTPALDHLTAVFRDATTTSVPAGTTLDGLASMIVVKAIYDDDMTFDTLAYGSTYTMSGTLTAGQSNAIEVSGLGAYSSLTPITFSVTVGESNIIISVADGKITTNATGLTVSDGKIILS